MRQNERQQGQKKKRSYPSTPEVVYTQPEPVDRKKLVLRLLTVCAVVLALFVGFSIFFRVDTIEISGTEQYNADTVLAVSGIEKGDSLLTFGKAKAVARIIDALPYVENVRVGIKLPGTVRIYIEEVDVVYSVQDDSDGWWFMTAEGRLVEPTNKSDAAKHTLIKGIRLVAPEAGEKAVAAEPQPDETYVAGEEEKIVVSVTNGERLQTVLDILIELEKNEILGEATVVDVTDMGNIELWYGTRTKVLLGDPGRMDIKVATMKAIVTDEEIDSSGIIDLTNPQEDGEISIAPL